MSPLRRRICLLTPGHVSSTPRLLKEADALAGAGYEVRVIAVRHFPPVDALDEAVLARASWRCDRLDATGGWAAAAGRLRQRLARMLVARTGQPNLRLSALALDGASLRIAKRAAAEPADLYVGHCLGTLFAAAAAARQHGTRFGFDLEDFHDGETVAAMVSRPIARAQRRLQASFLPRASYLTAAAPLIAAQYEADYGVQAETVLNVFPRSEAPAAPVPAAPIDEENPAVLYWFSQTIGGDRGLEQVMAALAHLQTPAVLHLRGFVSAAYQSEMGRLSSRLRLRHPPRFLPPADPGEMVRLASTAHAGISSEQPVVPNRDICLTNKLFTYLMAGIPSLLSPTRAHVAIAPELGAAARVLPLGEPAAAARMLDQLLQSPAEQAVARDTAWRLARTRFCWDIEQATVLRKVEAALATAP